MVLILTLAACSVPGLWTYEKDGTGSDAASSNGFDAETAWTDQVLPAIQAKGVDAPALVAAIEKDSKAAAQEHGVVSAAGGSPTFAIKGSGKVTKVDADQPTGPVTVDIGGGKTVQIVTGPVILGTALRDISGHHIRRFHQPDRLPERGDRAEQQVQDRRHRHPRQEHADRQDPGVPRGVHIADADPDRDRADRAEGQRMTVPAALARRNCRPGRCHPVRREHQQELRRCPRPAGCHVLRAPGQGQCAGGRERRRQVDADEDPFRFGAADQRSDPARRTAGGVAQPAGRSAGRHRHHPSGTEPVPESVDRRKHVRRKGTAPGRRPVRRLRRRAPPGHRGDEAPWAGSPADHAGRRPADRPAATGGDRQGTAGGRQDSDHGRADVGPVQSRGRRVVLGDGRPAQGRRDHHLHLAQAGRIPPDR